MWSFDDHIASAPAQILGSWNGEVNSFVWSWDNASIADPLCETAATVRAFGAEHDIARPHEPRRSTSTRRRSATWWRWPSASVGAPGSTTPSTDASPRYIAFGEVTLEEAGGRTSTFEVAAP